MPEPDLEQGRGVPEIVIQTEEVTEIVEHEKGILELQSSTGPRANTPVEPDSLSEKNIAREKAQSESRHRREMGSGPRNTPDEPNNTSGTHLGDELRDVPHRQKRQKEVSPVIFFTRQNKNALVSTPRAITKEPTQTSEQVDDDDRNVDERFGHENFVQRLRDTYGDKIVYPVDDGSSTVHIANFYKAYLHMLRKELVDASLHFASGASRSTEFRWAKEIFPEYVMALKNWEYVQKCGLKGWRSDPFILSTSRVFDLQLLQDVVEGFRQESNNDSDSSSSASSNINSTVKRELTKLMEDLKARADLPGGDMSILFGQSRTIVSKEEWTKAFVKRLSTAAIGGVFLIGPMLIMVLHSSLLTTLLTVSLCVCVFGLIMAIYLDKEFDVLSATAAYAAVLVVFVGTGGSSAGG